MTRKRVLVVLAVAAVCLLWIAAETAWKRAHRHPAGPSGKAIDERAPKSDSEDEAALKSAESITPAMLDYHQTAAYPITLKGPRALAVDADDEIYVGGDRAVVRYSRVGQELSQIRLEGEPRCLAVGNAEHVVPGRIYVGMEDHLEVFAPQGRRIAVWKTLGDKAVLTSAIALEQEVWAADAGNRIVWRYDTLGKLLGRVGQASAARHVPGFLITSHYFDLAAGSDGLVYVVNPRLLRVEGYTRDGDLETSWGKGSSAVADFFGCCNPAHLAVLPDGRFLTAEKGIPRVKVYSREGKFETVVAGPPQLSETPGDLAADHRGRVLVLDARAATVRVFERNHRSLGPKP